MPSTRLSVLVGEAIRSALARPIRFVALSLISGLILAFVVTLESGQTEQIVQARLAAEKAGVGVLIVDNSGSPFTGSGCSVLGKMDTTVGAGAVYDVHATRSSAVPNSLFQLASVSPGFPSVIDPGFTFSNPGSYVLGSDVGSVMSLGIGSRLQLDNEADGTIGGAIQSGPRAEQQARWLFDVVALPETASIRECWVEVAIEDANAYTQLIPSLFPEAHKLQIRRLASADSLSALEDGYDKRLTKYGWIASGLLVGAIALLSSALRRSEYALYGISGIQKEQLGVIAFVEHSAITGAATLFGLAAAFFFLAVRDSTASATLVAACLTVVMSVSLSTLVGLTTALLTGAIDVSRSLKNRD